MTPPNKPCPVCGGNDRFYFIVQPTSGGDPYWRCRVCDYTEVEDAEGETIEVEGKVKRTPEEIAASHYAYTVIAERCADTLWQKAGSVALNYLRKRGLSDTTIKAAKLGWCGNGEELFVNLFYQDRAAYDGAKIGGLRRRQGIPTKVLKGAQITIPYFDGDTCVLLRSRQIDKARSGPKYLSPAGPLYGGGLPVFYGHRHIANAPAVILTEGELKALAAWQEWRAGRVDMPTIATSGVQYLPMSLIEALRGKIVYLAYDNETPASGQRLSPADKALQKNGTRLQVQGIIVKVITIPRVNGAAKADLDSYLLQEASL